MISNNLFFTPAVKFLIKSIVEYCHNFRLSNGCTITNVLQCNNYANSHSRADNPLKLKTAASKKKWINKLLLNHAQDQSRSSCNHAVTQWNPHFFKQLRALPRTKGRLFITKIGPRRYTRTHCLRFAGKLSTSKSNKRESPIYCKAGWKHLKTAAAKTA